MVDNQHQKITGYRDLTIEEIEAMNTCKEIAKQVGIFIDELWSREIDGESKRWLSIAKTHLQQGFMAATRSIAKPETF